MRGSPALGREKPLLRWLFAPNELWSTAVVGVLVIALAGCSSSAPQPASSPSTAGAGTTTRTAAKQMLLFGAQGNNLEAYSLEPPFTRQRVNRAHKPVAPDQPDPNGWDINGQICSYRTKDGALRIITGEDTNQPDPPAGWGIFDVTGAPGSLGVKRVGRLVPTYQESPDGPDNYGCGVLADGRIVTTDIGNDAAGEANGQLTIWFPPFESEKVAFCKLDLHLSTGQSIYVDRLDRIYVVSPRPATEPDATASGVFRYSEELPTSADAKGGCGKVDNLGSPMADVVRKERVLSAGEPGLVAPSGVSQGPDGHWFVSSVITGYINEYDENWTFVRTVLKPPDGEKLGERPFSTGTPLGLTVGPDGTIYYADIGIVQQPGKTPGPGNRTGSVRRIRVVDGQPQPPEIMADGLAFPDGVGLVTVGG